MAKTPPSTIPTEGFEATSISVLPTTAHSRLSATTLPKCVTPRLPTYGCGRATKTRGESYPEVTCDREGQ